MQTSRLEAFSDGVLAIIITIMVLELNVPEHHTVAALWDETGLGLLTYLLSFVYIGIYWNNHHHMFQLTERATGGMLWANLHLLFWLSLYPFTTAWMDESHLARVPTTVYGVNLLGAALAYVILQSRILRAEGPDGPLRRALGRDLKGKISPVLYVSGIFAAAMSGEEARMATAVALGFYVLVAVIWVIPDTRIERAIVDG
ncbi:MAG TPA: TMEM175 family protein [Aeromicrobium sp.]|nr:TMEM175 family protein [Aeromicrobium sp.]